VSGTQAGGSVLYQVRSGGQALEGGAGDRSSYGGLAARLARGSAAALVVHGREPV
jgi:hypothetical protein